MVLESAPSAQLYQASTSIKLKVAACTVPVGAIDLSYDSLATRCASTLGEVGGSSNEFLILQMLSHLDRQRSRYLHSQGFKINSLDTLLRLSPSLRSSEGVSLILLCLVSLPPSPNCF